MKKDWFRAIAAVLCVTIIVTAVAACGKSNKEPADSLIASETFVPATVQAMEDEQLDALIKEVAGDDWDGDYSKLTPAQRSEIQKKLSDAGYKADITDSGVTYFSYTPTASAEEITEAVRAVLGDETWTGQYADLSDDEKEAVRDALRERGYDAQIGAAGFEFKGEADRKQETTAYYYNLLPTQEQIIGAVADVIGAEKARKWDGDLLSLTAEERKQVLKKLNDFGFDLAINEQGELYMVHNPENKTTYKTAYTPMEINGTTMEPTTIRTAEPDEPPENLTGTTASETLSAPEAERTALSTFGGTGGDTFRHVTVTRDGGYIVTAWFFSTDGDYAGTDKTWRQQKSAVIKYDKNGAFQWKATYGGKNLIYETGVILNQSAELADGSIVTVGHTGARDLGAQDVMDVVMICHDADGSRKWTKRFAGTEAETFECVCATPDGGFVAGGRSKSADGDFAGLTAGYNKAVLVKFSADGTKEWIDSFNSGTLAAYFNALAVTDEGYIYAACFSPSALGSNTQLDMLQYVGFGGADSVVFKFDPSGKLLTHRAIAGSGNDMVNTISIADQGVIVGGQFKENKRSDSVFADKHNYGGYDAFLIRLDASLNVEWVETFGGAADDAITGVVKIKGGYAAVGWSDSSNNAFSFLGSGEADAFVLTVSENGTDVQKIALNGTKRDQALGVTSRDGKQFAVVGSTLSATNMFSGLTPAPQGAAVSFFGLYRVK